MMKAYEPSNPVYLVTEENRLSEEIRAASSVSFRQAAACADKHLHTYLDLTIRSP